MSRTLQLLALLAALSPAPASAAGPDAPVPRTSGTGDLVYGVARMRVWTVQKTFATANVEGTIPTYGGGAAAAVIPWDTLVTVRPRGGAAGCVFSMTPDVLFGDLSGESACQVTDHGTTTAVPSSCWVMPDGIAMSQAPRFDDLLEKLPGNRTTKLCSIPKALNAALTPRRRPCKAYDPISTTAVVISSNVATVTASAHGLRPGMEITIASITTPLTTQAPVLTTADADTLTVNLTAANGAMADGAGTITVTPCPTDEGTCSTASRDDVKNYGGAILRCQVGTNSTLVEAGIEK